MGGRHSRNKGASFERDVAHKLSQHFGERITRILGQARDSGEDIDVGNLAIECKRRKTLKGLYAWFWQARTAAKRYATLRIPVVVFREDHGEMMAMLSFDDLLFLSDKAVRPVVIARALNARAQSQQEETP